jgi:hypothetical protein
MSSVSILPARTRDLGGFRVGRVLPSGARRLVGPFIFWDHMGPQEMPPGHGIDVRPHPHINLAAVTYLFAGEFVHKDSLGSDEAIRPGDVGWMTAGRGIVHSERTGAELRKAGSSVHGIQSWVALPAEMEESEPAFEHVAGNFLPEVSRHRARLRIIAGTAFGAASPVKTLSPLFYVEARLDAGAEIDLPDDYAERAAYVVDGAVALSGQRVDKGTMGVVDVRERATLVALVSSRVMLLGGAPVGKRFIWWNFVSSSEERIERAKREWKDGAFAKVPGDDADFIPLPE